MPGSLFARSPSPDPDVDDRHVHFTPSQSNSSPRSARRSRVTRTRSLPSPSSSSAPLRPPMIPSVRAAVQRFCADDDAADPSLLLPVSPTKTAVARPSTHTKPPTSTDGAGSPSRQRGDPSLGPRRDDHPDGSLSHPSSTSRRADKGKQRERDHSTDGSYVSEARAASVMAVRGKERELLAAREEHDRNERRWERDNHAAKVEAERRRDKERIRALEREIELLKEELAKRPSSWSRSHSALLHHPPPPPAPPPPNVVTNSTSSSNPSNATLFGSARAALRHTGTPVEAPINPPARTKRQGQPTVNVPSDKMAAFLNEIKTAKLKKVGSVQGLSRSISDSGRGVGGSSGVHRRASTGATVHGSGDAMPSDGPFRANARTSEKRKRSEHDITGQEAPAAKRHPPPTAPSASTSFSSSRERNPSSSTSLSRSYPSSSSSIHGANRTWPSIFIATETDLTTPSLCSDNDVDRLDETLPITPPDLQSMTKRPTKRRPPKEVIDVDMEEDVVEVVSAPPPSLTPGPSASLSRASSTLGPQNSPSAQRMSDILATKRPPTSPMPNPSPRKPRPPARMSARSVLVGHSGSTVRRDASDRDGSPLAAPSAAAATRKASSTTASSKAAMSQAGPSRRRQEPGYLPMHSASREPGPSRSSSRLTRGQPSWPTLEEELRAAGELEWSGDEEDQADVDLDSGVLVGVGTRDKRAGFLAHGGAGGIPVFMGVGYVEGTVDDGGHKEEEEDDRQPRRRVSNRRPRWQSADSGAE